MKRKLNPYILLITLAAFLFNVLGPICPIAVAQAQQLPVPGAMLEPSKPYDSVMVKGLMVNLQNPFKFDLLIDSGDSGLKTNKLQGESLKLIKYFLAALTVPDEEMWVNLSPYEKNRIISRSLGSTEMGRDLLAQDYILKQLTASLTYPEGETGRKFWRNIYSQVKSKLGTSNIPINTFNKVWIIPESAEIYEHENKAFIVSSKLKVMLEEDYLSLSKHSGAKKSLTHSLASQVVRQTIIPILEHEVNEGQYFANLRQIYQAMILATWYKIRLKESVLGKSYVNQGKTKGIALIDQTVNRRIYQQYLLAFKKGVYNFIKEERDPQTQEITPIKYFSGGYDAAQLTRIVSRGIGADPANMRVEGSLADVGFDVMTTRPYDPAMNVPVTQQELQGEYFSHNEDILNPAIERFFHDQPTDEEDFVRSLFSHMTDGYFIPRGIPVSLLEQREVRSIRQNKDLIATARKIKGSLEATAYFPKQRYFGFVISAFIGEQAFDDYTNVFFPRDMGPGYTIQKTLDSLDPVPRQEPGIYYLSRDTMGNYYEEVLKIINGEKLSGVITQEIFKELERDYTSSDEDLFTSVIRSSDFQEKMRRRAQSSIIAGTTDPFKVIEEITSEKALEGVIQKTEIKITPQQEARLVELMRLLAPVIPAMETRIAAVMEQKARVPFIQRVIARIREKINTDPAFERIVTHMRSEIEKLGLQHKPKVRFVDSGAGTFLLFLQSIFAIYYPDVETKSLALGTLNNDVIEVYDIQKWKREIQTMVGEKKILKKYANYTLQSMEDAEGFILHPIVYDKPTRTIVRTPDNVHFQADWTLLNFSLAAIDYMRALRKIQRETGQSLTDAARDMRERLGIRGQVDPETGQFNIIENPENLPPILPSSGTGGSSIGPLIKGAAVAIGMSLFPIPTDNNNVEPPTLEASMTPLPGPTETPDISITLNPPASLLPPFVLPEFPDLAHQQSTFVTRPGDTLSGLAYSFYGNGGLANYMKIFAANVIDSPFLISPHKLDVGVLLNIPDAKVELYTFKRGDTLENIARAFYGDATQWYRIAYLNRIIDPRKFKEGPIMIPMSSKEWNDWLNGQGTGQRDRAMNTRDLGGIDLNSKNLKINIKNDGRAMSFFNISAGRQQINALYPVNIEIKSVIDLPALLGLPRKPVNNAE